ITGATYTDSLLPEPVKHLEGTLSVTPDSIRIDNLVVQFESSDMTFSGKLIDPFPYLMPISEERRDNVRRPTFDFRVTSNRFDVDKLFPEAVPGAATEETPSFAEDSISMMILPDFNGGGTFHFDTLIYSRVELDNVEGKISIRERKIECYDATANVYSGHVSGKTIIDLGDFANPRYQGEFRGTQIEADDFVSRFSPWGGHVFGKLDVTGEYDARGWEAEAFLNSLTMSATSSMREGRLVTSGALYKALSQAADKAGTTFQKEQPLSNASTNITVKDGRVRMDEINTSLGQVGDVSLSGYYSFNDEINYNGTILLSEEWSEKLQSKGGVVGGLAGLLSGKSEGRVKLPLTIDGTITSPKVNLDFSAMAKDAGETLLKDKAEGLLNGLFKKKKKK
ncbi:MAG: hypothetical protein KAT79_07565, partial [candidate division Zixibacteria bacterium]|nr:hypothetical protein [candidate division Zixibacteria bacterium]